MCSPAEGGSMEQKYFQALDKFWKFLPRGYSSYLVTLAIVVFGITARGEWILIAVHMLRHFGVLRPTASFEEAASAPEFSRTAFSAEYFRLQNLGYFWLISNFLGFLMYYSSGLFLHWYWYVRQRDKPEEWKCQPTKWLPAHLIRNEIMWGTVSLFCTSTISSLIACYIANGGWSTIYYRFDEYTWLWYFLQWPVIFLLTDYVTYWLHRFYHLPWPYKHIHKVHHQYAQPTAFSVTASHPIEIMHIQLMSYCLPLVLIPTHWTSFISIVVYTFYNGIIDHSGIDFKAPWWQPWRPDTICHDNHHQYFHVNFGFNCHFWDKLHGTARRADRIYKEDIFYGRGKPLTEASALELQEEEAQRKAENMNAHRHMNPLLKHSSKTQENGTVAQKG